MQARFEAAVCLIIGGRHEWSAKASLPSLRNVMSAVSGTGIYRYNFETIELLRESVDQWAHQTASQGFEMRPYVAEVAFDSLEDAKERKFFNGIGTNFNLKDETVDRLIEVGGRLLRESPDFTTFLAELE